MGVLEIDARTLSDPTIRAIILLQQWHVDEVTGDAAASVYAAKLLRRLHDHGLVIAAAAEAGVYRSDSPFSDLPYA